MDGRACSMDGGPHPWIYPQVAFSIFKTPQAFISSLSVDLLPFFNIIGPPHPWIFHPIRGLSTSNRIDEYVQRSMDGDYPRVACNRIYVTPTTAIRNTHSVGITMLLWVCGSVAAALSYTLNSVSQLQDTFLVGIDYQYQEMAEGFTTFVPLTFQISTQACEAHMRPAQIHF